MTFIKIVIAIALVISLCMGMAIADRLPAQTPENQLIFSTEYVNVLGPVIKDVALTSEHSDAYLHDGIVFGMDNIDSTYGESVSQTSYKDKLRTNGGTTDLTYTLQYDTSNTIEDTYNLQTDTILTYDTVDGSTMMNLERATLDVVGNFETTEGNLRCVFASNNDNYIPAFCNNVEAESSLFGVTSMSAQQTLELRDTAESGDIPGAMSYKVDVQPSGNTGNYANGVVDVIFRTNIREANGFLDTSDTDTYYAPGSADWNTDYWDNAARVTQYEDRITVIGGITNLVKDFKYRSGITV